MAICVPLEMLLNYACITEPCSMLHSSVKMSVLQMVSVTALPRCPCSMKAARDSM